MKKLLLGVSALGALAVAAPAAAQYGNAYGNQYGNANAGGGVAISNRIGQLESRLQAGIQSGVIDRAEGREIRMDLRDLRRLERQYSADGLSQSERQDLQQRLRTIRQDIRLADNGQFDRDNRYGNWQDDDRYGQGGPYEEVCQPRAGIGGLVDTVFGTNGCSVQVGQRAPSNLGAVPSQYRYQFRDRNGLYYRSDGRSIYEIDARTNTVVRVHGMNR